MPILQVSTYPSLMRSYIEKGTSGPHTADSLCVFAVRQIGDLAMLRSTCIEAGADVNLAGIERKPQARLMYAAIAAVVRTSRKPTRLFGFVHAGARSSALHAASFAGNLGAVQLLLAHGADATSAHHPKRLTPLHLARVRGSNHQKATPWTQKATPWTQGALVMSCVGYVCAPTTMRRASCPPPNHRPHWSRGRPLRPCPCARGAAATPPPASRGACRAPAARAEHGARPRPHRLLRQRR